MQWLVEHLMGLRIKPHQNKQQLRLPTTGLSVCSICPASDSIPWGQVGKGRSESIRAPCTSFLPPSAQAHAVTFSSSVKPFTDYPLESRRGKQTPPSPLGRWKREVLAFPQVAELQTKLTARCNQKVKAQGRSWGSYFLLNSGCRYSQRKAAGIQELLISQHDFH